MIVTVRLSRDMITLLDMIAKRDGMTGRSALLREAAYHEIEARMENADGA